MCVVCRVLVVRVVFVSCVVCLFCVLCVCAIDVCVSVSISHPRTHTRTRTSFQVVVVVESNVKCRFCIPIREVFKLKFQSGDRLSLQIVKFKPGEQRSSAGRA